MSGLVLFLHGLGGDAASWESVPDFVAKSMGPDFVVETGEYSATKLSPADLETSANQIITLLRTKHDAKEPIYIIGHSLGGLVAREISKILLTNGPDQLLARLKAIVTAGSPLEGVPYGNLLLRQLRRLNPKVAALANPDKLYSDYREAIRLARKRSAPRPKLLHLALEADRVIAKQITDNFTDDDEAAGVLPGNHTGFAKGRKAAEYVADVIVNTIRLAQNSDSIARSTGGSTNVSVQSPHVSLSSNSVLPDRLILIACSHGKKEGGTQYQGGPLEWVPEASLRQDMLAKRNYIFSVMRDGKLVDNFERGGNRAHQPANIGLIHGIDLGGSLSDGEYLPAYERYSGRLYRQLGVDRWSGHLADQSKLKVLIMSGLYGLIEPSEFIQNYDIHLSDTHKTDGLDVKAQWLELYTRALDAYVRNAFSGGRRVHIFNFLCDHHYVDAIRWHSLPREACSVYHFASPHSSDVELLPPAGSLVGAVLQRPEILEGFERDIAGKYLLTDYAAAPDGLSDFRFGFESRVGLSIVPSEKA